jgi:hypothetical protein
MADITDLSGWTFGPPVAQPAGDQAAPQPVADITKHDPQTYATLTASAAIKNMHDMGLMPEVGTGQDIYKKALEDSQAHWTHEAEAAQAKNLELIARQKAVTSGTLAAEEQTKTAVQEQQKQWEQGPGAVAKAAELQKAGGSGEIKALGGDDLAKLDAMSNAYDSVNTLSDAFNTMMAKPHMGVGGQIKSLGGTLRVFADATSPEALAFSRAKDAAIVPVGRGVMGETGASPTKESMIELAQHTTMPRIEDDELTGNQGIFQLKQKIMQNLQNLRDNRANAGFDTTAIDKKIAQYNSDFMSPNVQKYNPFVAAPTVAIGTSPQADAAIDNLHTALGIPKPSTQSALPSQFQNAGTVAQPASQLPAQFQNGGTSVNWPHEAQMARANQLQQQIGGAVVGAGQQAVGVGKTILDWLKPFPTTGGQVSFPGQ